VLKFILTLILGIMIAPTFWRVAQRFNPRMSPGYVIGTVISYGLAEAHHLATSADQPAAPSAEPESRNR
jgi:hypothetical protein